MHSNVTSTTNNIAEKNISDVTSAETSHDVQIDASVATNIHAKHNSVVTEHVTGSPLEQP